MASSIKAASPVDQNENGLHIEEQGSFLTTIGNLLNYFVSQKETEEKKLPRTVGVGLDSYRELHSRIAEVRYELMSLYAQIRAFERMNEWIEQIDIDTLRRPDLDKVGHRLKVKEEELAQLLSDLSTMEGANLQYVKVEALAFEEDYLRYLIAGILERGDPESELTSKLITTLGTLKRNLLDERENLEKARIVSQK